MDPKLLGLLVFWMCWSDQGETVQSHGLTFREQVREYPELLLSPRFWGYSAASAFTGGAFFAFLGGSPYVGIEIYGLSPAGLGAYFAYFEHPFDIPSDELARRLVPEAGVLLLPGTMFMPKGNPAGKRQVRIAFANLDRTGLGQLFDRLRTLSF